MPLLFPIDLFLRVFLVVCIIAERFVKVERPIAFLIIVVRLLIAILRGFTANLSVGLAICSCFLEVPKPVIIVLIFLLIAICSGCCSLRLTFDLLLLQFYCYCVLLCCTLQLEYFC